MSSTLPQSRASVPGARLVDFKTAELRQRPGDNFLHLHVEGRLSAGDMEVTLAPRYYGDRPDYWAIEVVSVHNVHTETAAQAESFACEIPLTDILGLRGITVVGANRVQRIDVAPRSADRDAAL